MTSALQDTDGSETLRLEVTDIPVGVMLTDGVSAFVASPGNTTATITTWNLSNLSVTPPATSDQDFTLTVRATAEEAANADQSTVSDTIDVVVDAVADQPTLTVPATITVNEDTNSAAFTVSSTLNDTDGSETLLLEVSDIPLGATLTDGANVFTATAGNTTANISGWNLTSLSVRPPLNSDIDFSLTVMATATEGANGAQSVRSDSIGVAVTAVADQPNLTVPASIAVDEDTQSAAFSIESSLVDTDTSESLLLEVGNIPVGVELTDGTNSFTASTGNTSVDVTSWTLSNLIVIPAADSDQDFTLQISATASEAANSDQSQKIDSINVEVRAVADTPTLTVPSTVTVDEDTQSAAFTVSSSPTDTDGSETLLLRIGNVPAGATLTDGLFTFVATGTNNTVNVTDWNLNNLSVTAPADSDQDFALTVTATATESETADAAVTSDTINVEVNAVADQPVLTVPSTIAVDEDTNSAAFTISSSLADTDGSEQLRVHISGMPAGAILTDGVQSITSPGTLAVVNITNWSLTDLSITPPADSDADFTLTVTSTATEQANSDQAMNTDSILFEVNAVADVPALSAPSSITVNEDTESAAFSISSQLTDIDGSETLAIVIEDIPIGTVIGDGVNTFTATAGSTSFDVTAWDLGNLTVTPTANSDQDFDLTIAATATEAENGHQATRTSAVTVIVAAVADQPSLTMPAVVTVDEDGTTSAFAINATLVDADGSESLTIELSDIPAATTITDGTNTFTATAISSVVDVTGWNLTKLTVTPPADSDVDFRITVSATSTEADNADQATKVDLIDVQVTAVADTPTLTVPSTITVNEDTQSAVFAIASVVADVDGSESLKLEVSNVPVGALLTDGPNSFLAAPGFTTVDISSWDLSALTITAPANNDQNFALTVTATAREAENGDEATRSDTVNVEVMAVADTPTLTVPATVTIDEDTNSAAFSISSALTDADGSETLQLMVHDVPMGATLTDGTNFFTGSLGNHQVDVTGWNLSNLSVLPPADSDVDFTLTVVATATEASNTDAATKSDTIVVEVNAVADTPTLSVPATITVNEDTNTSTFTIASNLLDNDGSETLTLVIEDVPVGATLTDGGSIFTATIGNTSVDVTNWTLSNLQLTPSVNSDADFVLAVTATSTETANGHQATRSDNITVEVVAVADQPTLTVPATVSIVEDTASATFSIASALTDADGSETLLLTISDVPVGVTLTDGTNTFVGSNGSSTVDVTSWVLSNLTVTPPANSDVDFVLTVTASATETENLDQSVTSDTINVEVIAVADQPILTVPATVTVNEDTNSAAFTIASSLTDADGSESLRLEISAVPVGVTITDGLNIFTATTGNTTVEVTSWTLTNLSVTPPVNSDVDFELTVTATATETENGDASTRVDTIDVEVTAVADTPTLTVPATIAVDEDMQSAAFTISSALIDTDSSESLTLEISDIPVGATLADGIQTFTATAGNTTVDVTSWTLSNLSVTPPAHSDVDFELTVTATAKEAANSDQSIRVDTIDVEVAAVADQPDLTVPATITVDEDTQSAAFTISSNLVDDDGSESLTLVISDVPEGTLLTDGSHTFTATAGNTTVDVTTWTLTKLSVTPPADSDADFTLNVTATATEVAGDQSIRTDTIDVEVTAVADQPTLTVPATITVDEDTQSAGFSISSALTDTDASESLTLEIGDLPVGTFLTDGGSNSFTAGVGNTMVDVTGWALNSLRVTPSANSDADFALTVTATATEAANSDQSARSDTISVEVTAVADQPTLTVPATVTVDEDTQSAAFTISSSFTDTDGSESLQLQIDGVPVGATVTDGTNSFTATAGSTTVDVTAWTLTNLSVTPPADSDVDFALSVTSTSTEAANSDQSTRSDTISVEVIAVADQPTLTVPATITIDEDTSSAAFTISSSMTDVDASETLILEIANVPVGATLTDGTNTFTGTSGSASVDVTTWALTNLVITAPADSDVDFTLTVTATSTEGGNGDQSTRTDTIDVEIAAVADQPTLTVPGTVTVAEDTNSAAFTVSSALTDTDGSESLQLEIAGVPVGAILSDGTNSFTATTGITTVDVTAWTLTDLTVTPPVDSDVDFDLTVTATSTEAANGDHSSRTDMINVAVTAVADQPSLIVPATITVDEDTNSAAFTITSALTDSDASETLKLEVSGVPVGVTLTDGTNTFTGTSGNSNVDVTTWALTNLSVTPPADSDVNFDLTVTATAIEAANSDERTRVDTIDIEVTAVADQPTLTVPATIAVDEDTNSAAFTISSALTDTDASETLTLTVHDVPEGVTLTDGVNSFTATSGNATVDVTTWAVTNLSVTPPAQSDVDFVLRVTATATEAENNDQSTRTDTIDVEVAAVADQPTLTVPATITVDEDTQSAAFTISSALTDTDASESLSLEIAGVPAGATLSDGTHTFTATAGNTTVDVTAWSLGSLSVTPPADSDVDFDLTVTATATEAANGDQSSRVDTIDVEVTAVADAPALTVPATIALDEDTNSAAFTISSSLADVDGSETLTLEIGGVPVGATLTDGTNTFTGTTGSNSVDVTTWTLTNLSVTPPIDSDVDFTLSITATSTEAANGDQSTRTDAIDIEMTAVADQPTLTVPATIAVDEDTRSAAFTINSTLTDTDGSESLTLEIGDVPVGATLTDGTNTFTAIAGNTTVDVSNWMLTNLSVTAPNNSDVDFTLTVTATATEAANTDQGTRSDTISVEVTAVADQPKLTVPSTITFNEDTDTAAFAITSSLTDVDGSETLVLEIGDVPVGATLTDGTNTFTATTGNTTVDVTTWILNNLSVTPPADSDVDFALTVTATATEAANGDQNTRIDTVDFEVVAVADQPNLTVPATITVDEDTNSAAFTISSSLTDTDTSEVLSLEVSDIPFGATLTDGTHSFTATFGGRSVDVTGWAWTNLSVTPPADSDVDFELTVTATAMETENGDQSTRTDTIDVEVTAVADVPTLTVPSTVAMNEDTRSAALEIDAQLVDTDRSESLLLTISDIPVGATLTDGRDSFTATFGNTTVDVSDWRLHRLTVTAPADSDVDFTLTIAAAATEAANNDAATAIDTIDVQVTAVADMPNLTVPSTVVFDEDTTSTTFAIISSLADADGSETLALTISDVPEGVTLTDGTHTFVGGPGADTVDVSNWSLSTLTLSAPADSDDDFVLQVTAVATETANGDNNTNTDTISVEVNAVADEPTLVVPATIRSDSVSGGTEFSITAGLNDTDGSETLILIVSDLPVGTVISDGVNSFTSRAAKTEIDIAGWSLATLSVTAPPKVTDDFVLTVTASAVESENGDTYSSIDTILVEVEAIADEPILTVPSTIRVDEDSQSAAFTIAAELADADGSEYLTLTVSDIPEGTVLSDGTNSFTAAAGNPAVDITVWNLTQLTVTAAPDSDVDFDLTVTAIATETMNSDTVVRTDSIEVRVAAVADQPTLTVLSTVTVAEDTQSGTFAISSSLTDVDGSETLVIVIDDVPRGVTISDGTNSFTSNRAAGSIGVTDWDLSNLSVTPPSDNDQNFTLTVTATATEGENRDQASRVDAIVVEVDAVADTPVLTVPAMVSVDEDTRSARFKIDSDLTGNSGSETLAVQIGDIPVGATITDGSNTFTASAGNTTLDATSWNLNRLFVTAPADNDVDFTLTVTSTATETENGDTAQTVDTIDVEVAAVADQPLLTVPSTVTFDEDSSTTFAIATSLTDVDGSETLALAISDIPLGVTVTDGVHTFTGTLGNSSVNVTDWALSNLTLSAPADSDVDFDLQVTSMATEAANGDASSRIDSIAIVVNAVADEPTLVVPSTISADAIAGSTEFAITADLNDVDGSESLALVVSNLPVGTTITDGDQSFTARANKTEIDITRWSFETLTVIPAENVGNFTLQVTATATEQDNGDTFSSVDSIVVEVTALANEPELNVPATIRVAEDTQSATFEIAAKLADTDGSESLTLSVSDLPTGTVLTDGTHTFTASGSISSVTITDWDLGKLTITAAPNSDVDFDVTVTATATETSNADYWVKTDSISVRVDAVADAPTLTVPSTIIVAEDSSSSTFAIAAALTDTDGSETLTLSIGDIPRGVTISDGTNSFTSTARFGSVDVTGWDVNQLTVTPMANSDQPFTLTVTASSTESANNDRATREDAILVQVSGDADQPTLTVPSKVVVEEDTRSASFKINAKLADSVADESLTVTISDLPVGATLTDGSREFVGSVGNTTVNVTDWNLNRLRVTAPADSDVDFTLTVTATAETPDSDTATNVHAFDVEVTAVADQPLLTVPAELDFQEDETVSFGITANLQDVDGSETLAATLRGLPVGATLSDGVHTLTNSSGTPTIDVSAWDLNNLQLTLADHSGEGFELIVEVTSTENANLDQALATQTIKAHVTPVADLPLVSMPTEIAVDEDTQSAPFEIVGTLVDQDGSELLSVTVGNVPEGVTLTDGTNSFTGTRLRSEIDISGWDLSNLSVRPPVNSDQDFTLTVDVLVEERGSGSTAEVAGEIDVVVTAIADQPTLDAPVTINMNEGATSRPFDVTSQLADTDGSESLGVELVDIPVGFTVSDGTNDFVGGVGNSSVDVTDWELSRLTLTPQEGNSGDFTMTVVSTTTEAANDDKAVAQQTIQVTINPINDVPVAVDDAYVLNEDETLHETDGVLINDFDGEGDALTAELVTGPLGGTVVFRADGTFTYTPDADFHGTDGFTYQVSDGQDTSTLATVHLTIRPVEDAPIAIDDAFTVNEDDELLVTSGGVLANDLDADSDLLEAALLIGPTHGSLELNSDGTFSYRPDADFHGQDSFTYLAGDGTSDSNVASVNINVLSVNDAPTVKNWTFEVDEDARLDVDSGSLLGGSADLESDQLNTHVVEGARHGTVEVQPDGSFRYIPNKDYSGNDSFTYRANDGVDDSNLATVQVTVHPVNDNPFGEDNVYISLEDQVLEVSEQGVLVDDFDSDGDQLAAILVTSPVKGTLDFELDGTFSYIPVEGFVGDDTFTYVANDGTVNSEVITVTLRVLPNVLPPTTETPTTEVNETPDREEPSILPTTPDGPTLVVEDTGPDGPVETTRERGETRLIAAVTGSREVKYEEVPIGERGIIDWSLEPRRLQVPDAVDDSLQGLDRIEGGGLLWKSLDQLAESTREASASRMLIIGSALVFSALGSIAYTIWTVWCGFLTTSILSLMPGWKLLDPLPVLEEEKERANGFFDDEEELDDDEDNDESLASLVESNNSKQE